MQGWGRGLGTLLAALALCGCAAGSHATVLPALTVAAVSPAATPAGTASETPAGAAAAFTRSYFAALNLSYNDASWTRLLPLADPACRSCAHFVTDLRQLAGRGDHLTGPSFTILDAEAPPLDSGPVIVDVVYSCPPQLELDASGRTVHRLAGAPTGTFVVTLQRRAGRWQVRKIQLP